jgi:hypothetical protein
VRHRAFAPTCAAHRIERIAMRCSHHCAALGATQVAGRIEKNMAQSSCRTRGNLLDAAGTRRAK